MDASKMDLTVSPTFSRTIRFLNKEAKDDFVDELIFESILNRTLPTIVDIIDNRLVNIERLKNDSLHQMDLNYLSNVIIRTKVDEYRAKFNSRSIVTFDCYLFATSGGYAFSEAMLKLLMQNRDALMPEHILLIVKHSLLNDQIYHSFFCQRNLYYFIKKTDLKYVEGALFSKFENKFSNSYKDSHGNILNPR